MGSRLASRGISDFLSKAALLTLLFSFSVAPAFAAPAVTTPAQAAAAIRNEIAPVKITTLGPVPSLPDTDKPSGKISPLVDDEDTDPVPTDVREAVAEGSVVNPDSGSNPGAFIYKFPFTLPPGRNGMTPSLELDYSSTQNSDSGFGYDWSLSIPYIERYNKTGFDDLYSTTSPSTSFYSSMSGELVASTSTAYLARNDDGSDLQYVFSGNAWTVTDKAGNTYLFGTASTSQQTDPGGSGETFKWMLQKETDPNGNSISYAYTKDAGQIYPANITYTNTATTSGIFAVNFALGLQATSSATSTATGFAVKTRYQINTVSVLVNSATTSSYALAYGVGDNGSRTLLTGITETGTNSSGNLTLPANVFSYSTSTITSMATSSWSNPAGSFIQWGYDRGVEVADVNGDGLADLAQSYEVKNPGGSVVQSDKNVYMNTGAGWTTSTSTYSFPCDFVWGLSSYGGATNEIQDAGGRLVDLNGDGLPDMVCGTTAYINTGTTWVASSTYDLPVSTIMSDPWGNSVDAGVRFADVNGDGLLDLVQAADRYDSTTQEDISEDNIYLNNGHGWDTASGWSLPGGFLFTTDVGADGGGRILDLNGDGIADLATGDTVYVNSGHGWIQDDAWTIPSEYPIQGLEVSDVNGDGLPDLWYGYGLLSDDSDPSSFTWSDKDVYLNTGAGWKESASSTRPLASAVGNIDTPGETSPRSANISGSGLSDLIVDSSVGHIDYGGIQFATGTVPDLLDHITESGGKQISVTYKATTDLYTASSTLANPKLPDYFQTAQQIQYNDGVSATTTNSYLYQGGAFYFASSTDRRFAGFGEIDSTDGAGNVAKTYYDTGNGTATSTGQVGDDQAKIGKSYRNEDYDGAGDLYKTVVNLWSEFARGLSNLVVLGTTTELDYDGEATHKDSAQTFTYDHATANPTQEISWGQVTAANDGTFTDTGSDKRTTSISYAASTTIPFALPSEKATTDQTGTTTSDTRYYYDGLSLGSLAKGNLTEQDDLKTGPSTFVQTVRNIYNSLGLLTQTKDARGNATNYSYDAYNLYPATSTNALSQSTTYQYDYALGKPTQSIDPNGSITDTVYDAINRVLAILRPDPTDTSVLATTSAYVYTDSGMPRKVEELDYLDASTVVPKYTYLDGFGRDVEDRTQSETSDVYTVTDTSYNPLGLVYSSALPYFGSGTAYTGTSSPAVSDLLTIYAYDPLQRATKITNVVGTTTNSYGNWEVTTTDADGNKKDYYKDAYGNLANVVEYNGASIGTTTYAYDANNDLAQLTDALGNVRNFTYDDLKRLLTAQDLHAATDTTFGIWQYGYDDAGNLTQATTANDNSITYTYDALNRVLTEDSTTTPYTDVSYGYDGFLAPYDYGIGRISSVSTAYTGIGYDYDLNGNISVEQHIIPGASTTTMQYWYDRQHNPTYLYYPDGAYVFDGYNIAGLPSYVEELENGSATWNILAYPITHSPLGLASTTSYGNATEKLDTYDATDLYRLRYEEVWNGTNFLQLVGYGYDPVGNLNTINLFISHLDSGKFVNYTYDGLNRLTEASTTDAVNGQNYDQTFGYNAIGGITSSSGTNYLYQGSSGSNYANPDAPTSVGAASYTYDHDGNLLTDGTLANTWNYRDELLQSVSTVGSTTATSTYGYDADGNRAYTIIGTTTEYIYPNKYFSAASDGSWDKYVYVGNTPIATIHDTSTTTSTHYTYSDYLGNTDAVADTSGNLQELLDYYPYGGLRLDEASTTFSNQKKFIGQYYDQPTTLNYLNARYYNSATGQFLSEDPASLDIGNPKALQQLTQEQQSELLMDPQSLNAYSYGGDNPLTNSDTSGLWYGQISFGGDFLLFNASAGIQFNGSTIQAFAGAGPAFGVEGPISAKFSSGSLPPGSAITVSRNAELMAGAGLGISKGGNYNYEQPLTTGANETTSYSTDIGIGGGVSQEYILSTPVVNFGGSTQTNISSRQTTAQQIQGVSTYTYQIVAAALSSLISSLSSFISSQHMQTTQHNN